LGGDRASFATKVGDGDCLIIHSLKKRWISKLMFEAVNVGGIWFWRALKVR